MSEERVFCCLRRNRLAIENKMGTECLETFALYRNKSVSSLEDISEASILSIGQLEMEGAIVFAFGLHPSLLHPCFQLRDQSRLGSSSSLAFDLKRERERASRNQLWNFSNLSVILRFLLCPGSS